ncbi:MAG: hypothetical protein JXR94_09650, partial [Candidatus Hydrogenedentes bacterium]|nr:hypothetical protein [Candidatus Hydrogenedentota bacterium]
MRHLLAPGLICAFIVAAAGLECACAADDAPSNYWLVRDGQPAAAVVVAEGAGEPVRRAAELFVATVRESTGAELPVVHEPPGAGTAVFVGPGPWTDAAPVEQEGLDDDGFDILFPDEHSILILGPTDYGTEFGVCEFLERFVGVRWLLPGPDGTDVPKHT